MGCCSSSHAKEPSQPKPATACTQAPPADAQAQLPDDAATVEKTQQPVLTLLPKDGKPAADAGGALPVEAVGAAKAAPAATEKQEAQGDVSLPVDCSPAGSSPVHIPPSHMPSAPVIHQAHAPSPPARAAAGEVPLDGGASASTEGGRSRDKPPRRSRPSNTLPANFFKGLSYNGFKTGPEVPAFSCTEEGLAPYSLPAEALTYEPLPETVVTTFKNGDHERKIHCNIRLTESELERLSVMRGEARAQGMEFSPSVTAMATRFLSRARMDAKKALKLMKETNHWRQEYFRGGPLTDESVKEDMQHGIVYFTGRDCSLRPAIVIRANRIPQQWYRERRIDKFIRILIYSMEYFLRYMIVPGRVENLSVIVDLAGLGLGQVPLGPLGEVYKVMSHHYIGRVFKFYVCNISSALSTIAGMARSFLTDRQKQKLNMLDDVKELRKEFALHQLEEDLGGTRPKFTQFYPFPLCPGPYAAGYDGPPDEGAVPEVHDVLTPAGALGRLWDPKLSDEENSKLDYGPKAASILRRCNLPVPPELLMEREGSYLSSCARTVESLASGGGEAPAAAGEVRQGLEQEPSGLQDKLGKTGTTISTGDAETCSNPEESELMLADNNELGMDEVVQRGTPKLQNSMVCGGEVGFFCCKI